MMSELLACPWCASGTTTIEPNGRTWLGMRWSEPTSVSVRHWCEKVEGQPSRMIERIGRDEQSAVAAWNNRAAPTAPPHPAESLFTRKERGRIEFVEERIGVLKHRMATGMKRDYNDENREVVALEWLIAEVKAARQKRRDLWNEIDAKGSKV